LFQKNEECLIFIVVNTAVIFIYPDMTAIRSFQSDAAVYEVSVPVKHNTAALYVCPKMGIITLRA
jgi:hypothetical protein